MRILVQVESDNGEVSTIDEQFSLEDAHGVVGIVAISLARLFDQEYAARNMVEGEVEEPEV